jgi:hypothetical protein
MTDAASAAQDPFQNKEAFRSDADVLDHWLSSSEAALASSSATAAVHHGIQQQDALGVRTGLHEGHARTQQQESYTQFQGQSSKQHLSQQPRSDRAGHTESCSPLANEAFSLSQLAAAQQVEQHPPDLSFPTEQRESGGGIAWALEPTPNHPVSHDSESHREDGSKIFGRQSGHVAAARVHDMQHTSMHEAGQPCKAKAALQPIPRKPSTAALLRRLSRKKPTVRQILNKSPQPHNALSPWRQVCPAACVCIIVMPFKPSAGAPVKKSWHQSKEQIVGLRR